MKITGWPMALRIGGLLTVVVIGGSACGSSSQVTGTAPPPGTASATPSPAASLPAGCHGGVADSVDTTLAILTDPSDCPGSVNAYWTSQLGSKWTDPVYVPYRDGEIPDNACGKEPGAVADDFADNAFYCPDDNTIAYSRDLLDSLFKKGGPYLPVVVLEHEAGHRANDIAGTVGAVSRSEENQADCDAGLTTAFARTAGRLPLSDVIAAGKLLYDLGDSEKFGAEMADSPDAHGTPAQRAIAFTRGYFQQLSTCRKLGESDNGSVA
jgi:predicted metalloprotease